MESFTGFKRVAVVVCPKPEELEKRTKEKKEKKGFEVPEFALNDMKANFTLPRVGPLLNEVKFIEENEEESTKIVAEYKRKARSSNDRGSNSYRRRDHGQKGSSRFHPYKRDDQRSNRGGGGGGNRDRRSGGRGGGGGSNYGRQHGGSSHDRRSGGGYNKGNQNYSKGGNRSGGNRGGGGNFQKNFQYQQQQQQQQRYTSYAAAPQYR